MFDIGGIFGSIALGFLSDRLYAKRSPVAFLAIWIAFLMSMCLTFVKGAH